MLGYTGCDVLDSRESKAAIIPVEDPSAKVLALIAEFRLPLSSIQPIAY